MRFLADESCDGRVVHALRLAGHDVKPVREIAPELPDDEVIAVARLEDRVLITEDRDFGQIFFAAEPRSVGVILIRFPTNARTGLPRLVVEFIEKRGPQLRNNFTVLDPGGARIGSKR
jgi:predicted nuclease of predicted toxin-antitoxin system